VAIITVGTRHPQRELLAVRFALDRLLLELAAIRLDAQLQPGLGVEAIRLGKGDFDFALGVFRFLRRLDRQRVLLRDARFADFPIAEQIERQLAPRAHVERLDLRQRARKGEKKKAEQFFHGSREGRVAVYYGEARGISPREKTGWDAAPYRGWTTP